MWGEYELVHNPGTIRMKKRFWYQHKEPMPQVGMLSFEPNMDEDMGVYVFMACSFAR